MKIFIVLMFLLITGCAATPDDFDAATHKKASIIKLYDSSNKPDQEYTVIKKVMSNSCGDGGIVRISGEIEDAKLILKLEAATVGADAVIDYKCWSAGVDLVSNCWVAKKCEGIAVKFVK